MNLQDEIASRIYRAPGVERQYLSTALDTPETMAFIKYQPCFAHRRVLDVGVGTGRTSRFLQPFAASYTCLDFSPPMVEYIRANLPWLDVHLADMRDLSEWRVASFDFILASNNVLDAVSHEDRLLTLRGFHHVLDARGLLMFSSHNRRYRRALGGPRLHFSRNPVTQGRYAAQYMVQMAHHARTGRFRRFENEYALLDDVGHDFQLLHYYIDRATQRRQLEQSGFTLLDVFDNDGMSLQDGDDDADSGTLLYVAQRSDDKS